VESLRPRRRCCSETRISSGEDTHTHTHTHTHIIPLIPLERELQHTVTHMIPLQREFLPSPLTPQLTNTGQDGGRVAFGGQALEAAGLVHAQGLTLPEDAPSKCRDATDSTSRCPPCEHRAEGQWQRERVVRAPRDASSPNACPLAQEAAACATGRLQASDGSVR